MQSDRVVVVGATNMDLSVTSFSPILHADSNPGRMRVGHGGVGRNIAENLTRLGDAVSLVTALGNDAFSSQCAQNARALGMDISASLYVDDAPASVYVCVNEPDGDIYVAVSDMELCNRITPAFLQEHAPLLDSAPLIVTEANLSEASLTWLARRYAEKLVVDSVSERKAARLRAILPRLLAVKANRGEASVLTGLDVVTPEDDTRAANVLHSMGVRYVLITRGEEGAFVSADEMATHMPSLVAKIVNTTGCGDAFLAGCVHAILGKRDLRDCLAFGLATAALCAQSELAVSPETSSEAVLAWLKQGGIL